MKEFGSDFQLMPDFRNTVLETSKVTLYDVYGCLREYASGRHAIEAIFKFNGWKRIWTPAYFCYEVIEYLDNIAGMEIKLYDDTPLSDSDDEVVRSLPYEEGDVLLRMNFYGLRGFRSNEGIEVPVIEDHTHDMMSEWARKSDADYCIASIRKSMPIAAGGILWSQKGLQLPEAIDKSNFIIAGIDTTSLLQAVDTAVELNNDKQYGIPVPDYVDENVSTKVVKIIQSYVGIVNKMVWRKF